MEMTTIELVKQLDLIQKLASSYNNTYERDTKLVISTPDYDPDVGSVLSISIDIVDHFSDLGVRNFDISVKVGEDDNILCILIPAIVRLIEFIKQQMGLPHGM